MSKEDDKWKQEAEYLEGLIASTYDEIDNMQNALAFLKQKIKNTLNKSPMKTQAKPAEQQQQPQQ